MSYTRGRGRSRGGGQPTPNNRILEVPEAAVKKERNPTRHLSSLEISHILTWLEITDSKGNRTNFDTMVGATPTDNFSAKKTLRKADGFAILEAYMNSRPDIEHDWNKSNTRSRWTAIDAKYKKVKQMEDRTGEGITAKDRAKQLAHSWRNVISG